MMRLALIVLFVAAAALAAAPQVPTPRYAPILPPGAVEYQPEQFTQEIAITNDLQRIARRPIKGMADTAWHQSGGMHGLPWAKSRKFKSIPGGDQAVTSVLKPIPVLNSLGYYQSTTPALTWTFPEGTRFDDVLYLGGWVFEHRVREKKDGRWRSYVIYSDKGHRPPGYAGLTRSCADCHDRTQTGNYGASLVPGSDTVFSFSPDWSVAARVQWYQP